MRQSQSIERDFGLEFARRWRVANRPKFDALYGAEGGRASWSTARRATPEALAYARAWHARYRAWFDDLYGREVT